MSEERNLEITVQCDLCGEEFTMRVKYEDFIRYTQTNRPHIQDIFPYLTPAERELLISHTCDKCWQKMFKFGE